ncbi:MAG TPA: lytic murein transglycosylase [Solirubrobacteraceae bacterium]|jgi:hypothetical protein|nr:lytic murein transglycosylase [Solirubrobacteraceae bacterium]
MGREPLGRPARLAPAALLVAAVATVGLALAIAGVLTGVGGASSGCGPAGPVDPAASGSPSPAGPGAKEIPRWLVPLYLGAARRYHLGAEGWSWLAAINAEETDFGRNLSTSSAGAVGWMQFEPATWRRFGVDANHDGRRDPRDPVDAIFSAARYLWASEAPGDWHQAVLTYNHSQSYYAQVAARAASYRRPSTGGGLAPTVVAASAGPAGPTDAASAGPAGGGYVLHGYGSTFSDHRTAGRHPADGGYPGIAVPVRATLNGYWLVTYPNGHALVLEQIDIGPAPGLGPAPEHRVVDSDTAAAIAAGYAPSRFPTDHGLMSAIYLGRSPEWAALNGQPAGAATGGCQAPAAGSLSTWGYALPLDRRYLTALGRTDDGVDIETAPDGARIYSIAAGLCTAVASNPSGFGPAYPVVRADSGPLRGQFVYYGHAARALVHAGQRVIAGQAIAVVGHTGDAAGLGHGHVEIGFSDAGGNPLNHHGASAATPAGTRMRHLLIELAAGAGIRLS